MEKLVLKKPDGEYTTRNIFGKEKKHTYKRYVNAEEIVNKINEIIDHLNEKK